MTSAINTSFPTSSPLSTCGLPSLWTYASSIRHCSMVWQTNSWCCLNTLFIYLIIATCSSKQSQNQQIVHVNNFNLEPDLNCRPTSANQYYILWHTLKKMNKIYNLWLGIPHGERPQNILEY